MRFLLNNIFSEFKDKILDEAYYPARPIEALKARLTATWVLQNHNTDIVRQAIAFINKTSTFKKEDSFLLQ